MALAKAVVFDAQGAVCRQGQGRQVGGGGVLPFRPRRGRRREGQRPALAWPVQGTGRQTQGQDQRRNDRRHQGHLRDGRRHVHERPAVRRQQGAGAR